jgi:type III secretion system needle length determinant
MKVNETRPVSQPNRAPSGDDLKKKGAFSKVLEQKAGQEALPGGLPSAPVEPLLRRNDAAEDPAPVRSTVTARDVDGLAHEISIAVRGGDVKEVEIQMDSKTMSGLHIRISKENGRLNVKMQANSAEMSRLLSQQSDALVQRLESRGYSGAVVQVQSTPVAASRDPRGRERRGQDSGGGQNSRDRQNRQQ